MRPDEARQRVIETVQPTTQHVVIAKQYLLSRPLESGRPTEILKLFVRHIQVQMPDVLTFNASTDATPLIAQVGTSITWQLAFHEAVWDLIHAGELLVVASQLEDVTPYVQIFEGYPGRGGARGEIYGEFTMAFPQGIIRSRITDRKHTLASPDLYLAELNVAVIHEDIRFALLEAVRCFKHELYLSAVVMIGRAAEGAWTEVGNALQTTLSATKLADPLLHIGKRINDTEKILETKDGREYLKRAGVSIDGLHAVVNWSHLVRDARNAVHYGTTSSTQNNYEKAAVLLLSTIPNIRFLYQLIDHSGAGPSHKP
jgi:hypothetical protein